MTFSRELIAHLLVVLTVGAGYMAGVLLLLAEQFFAASLIVMIGWVVLHVELQVLPDWVNQDD